MAAESAPHPTTRETVLVFAAWLVGLMMLAFAPWVRGGKPPMAALMLVVAALVLVALLALAGRAWRAPDRAVTVAVVLAVAGFLLPLLPVPADWWAALPGRAPFAEALALAGVERGAWVPLSLTPTDSVLAAFRLVPPLAMLALVFAVSRRQLTVMLHLALGVAVLEALLALVQFPQGPDSPLRFGMPWAESSGSYVNRNHLAGLLEMLLPVALALLTAAVVDARRRHGERGALLHAAPLAFLAITIALLLGLVFSRSRAGLLLALAGLMACAWTFGRPLVGARTRGALPLVLAVVALAALAIGLHPVIQRFTASDLVDQSRLGFTLTTLRAAWAFFPLGSGTGSFDRVFPWFQPDERVGPYWINEAHNDYAQALLEGGVLLGAAIVAGLWALLRGWRRMRAEAADLREGCWKRGAGIGVALLLLHGVVDFNLQTPANALYFAMLCGVFLRPASPPGDRGRPVDRPRRRTPSSY